MTTSAPGASGQLPLSAHEAAQAALLLRPVSFVLGVTAMVHLPAASRPEVAFAGRSNVGKSSLLNALVNRRGLARASNTPGRTRELNYFAASDDLGYLVDLPGYGYAVAGKDSIAQWTKLTRAYLVGRPSLRRVFVLIDARHGVKPNDLALLAELNAAAVSFQVLLTKADKIKAKALAENLAQAAAALAKMPAAHPDILATSAEKKTGLDQARLAVTKALLGR